MDELWERINVRREGTMIPRRVVMRCEQQSVVDITPEAREWVVDKIEHMLNMPNLCPHICAMGEEEITVLIIWFLKTWENGRLEGRKQGLRILDEQSPNSSGR